MILVDSSVGIDYFRGASTPQSDALDVMLGNEPVAIGDLILTEVLQGFRTDRDFNRAKKLLTSLSVIDLGGQAVAIQGDQGAAPFFSVQEATFSDCPVTAVALATHAATSLQQMCP